MENRSKNIPGTQHHIGEELAEIGSGIKMFRGVNKFLNCVHDIECSDCRVVVNIKAGVIPGMAV
jgi:hypothetical protein